MTFRCKKKGYAEARLFSESMLPLLTPTTSFLTCDNPMDLTSTTLKNCGATTRSRELEGYGETIRSRELEGHVATTRSRELEGHVAKHH